MQAVTIASSVAAAVGECSAISFSLGTAVQMVRESQSCTFRTVTFPAATKVDRGNNEDGRCVYWEGVYADGSRLVFRWSKEIGSRIQTFDQ